MELVFSGYAPLILEIDAYSETAASCTCMRTAYHDNCSKRPISIILMYTLLNCYFMFDLWYVCCVFFCFYPFLKNWNSGRSCGAGISFSWSSTGKSYWIYGSRRRLTQGCQLLLSASSGGTVGHYLSLGILWKIILPFSVYNLVYFFLQDFTPEEGRYDVIWIQWCIGQLPDDDFISFFNRAKVTWLWLR
jgi:hypothetical protein